MGLMPLILSAGVVGLGIRQMNTTEPPSRVKAIALDSKGKTVASTSVNQRGKFKFNGLPAGTYDIKIVSLDYKDTLTLKQVEAGENIAEYKTELAFTQPKTNPADRELRKTEFEKTSIAPFLGGHASYAAPAVSETRVDAVERRDYMEDYGPDIAHTGKSSKEGDYTIVPGETPPVESADVVRQKAGQLTASQWRDLDNWEKWLKTNNDEEVKNHQNTWNMYPVHRFAFEIADKNKKPLIAARLNLVNSLGEVVWTTYTDNLGRAEMWPTLYAKTQTDEKYTLQIVAGEQSAKFSKITYGNTLQKFEVKFEAAPLKAADIAFVVDATGSMGDEIAYLQAEMLDVITRAQGNANCLNLRLGSVFYRDNGDEYVTRVSDFNNNFIEVSDFMMEQSAAGGGDFPEAVDAALQAAVDSMQWRSNAVAKILFLVLDAPPHSQPEQIAKMQKYTKLAAEKGIKIIPIASSGIDKPTEFLMKYLAIATNGTYVYLTDHSGIGNSHLKPTGVKEDVGYLNDILVKIVNDNLKIEGCEINNNAVSPNLQPGTVEIKTNGQWQVQFYPNPAVNEIKLKSTEGVSEVSVVSLRGQTLLNKKYDTPLKEIKMEVSNFNSGVYVVTVKKGEQVITCKMMVLH